jgi:hypothetical protein
MKSWQSIQKYGRYYRPIASLPPFWFDGTIASVKCKSSQDIPQRTSGERFMSHHYSGPDYGFPHGDARLDLTDLYSFPSPENAGKSILVMNVHPSAGVNPSGPTTDEPFAPNAIYELKIDTNGNSVADIAYRVRSSSSGRGSQTATMRRIEGVDAAGTGVTGQVIIEHAPVSSEFGVASVTICRKKLRRPLPRPSSTSIISTRPKASGRGSLFSWILKEKPI